MTEPNDPKATRNLNRLISQLGSLFRRRRERAFEVLRDLPDEQVQPLLLSRLTKDLRAKRGWILRQSVSIIALSAVTICATTAIFNATSHVNHIYASELQHLAMIQRAQAITQNLVFVMFVSTIGTIVVSACRSTGRYVRMWKAAGVLSLSPDPILIGPLTELICDRIPGPYEASTTSVHDAWARMLPTVTAESANAITSRQRRMLRAELSKLADRANTSVERRKTAIAVMQCLATIGDMDALPILDRIAKWDNVEADEQAVAAQALECLQSLNRMKEQGRSDAVLLRSSSDPRTLTETLLRAANESTEVDAATMLRAELTVTAATEYGKFAKDAAVEEEHPAYVSAAHRGHGE